MNVQVKAQDEHSDRSKLKQVEVFMPDEKSELTPSPATEIRCMTHTGSDLRVSASTQSARINTVSGETLNYLILNSNELKTKKNEILSTYVLDDRRKIVLTFNEGSEKGHGFYLRNDGDKSPSFPCEVF